MELTKQEIRRAVAKLSDQSVQGPFYGNVTPAMFDECVAEGILSSDAVHERTEDSVVFRVPDELVS